jgi:hypothetical protein
VKKCPSAAETARKDEHFQRASFHKFDRFSRSEARAAARQGAAGPVPALLRSRRDYLADAITYQ